MEKETNRVKITVLKCFDMGEVFKDRPIKVKYSGPCPIFKEGQVLYIDKLAMPNEFRDCPVAWHVIFLAAMTLTFGGNFDWWYEEDGKAVICCPDGLRPVVFKLERTH